MAEVEAEAGIDTDKDLDMDTDMHTPWGAWGSSSNVDLLFPGKKKKREEKSYVNYSLKNCQK